MPYRLCFVYFPKAKVWRKHQKVIKPLIELQNMTWQTRTTKWTMKGFVDTRYKLLQYESVNAIRFYCCEAALKIHPPKNKFMLPLSPLKPMVLKTNSATTNISPLHLSLNISKQFNSFSSQHVAMYHWCTSRSFHPVEPFLWKTQQGNSSFNLLEVMIYWAEMRDKLLANIALNFALQDYTSIV